MPATSLDQVVSLCKRRGFIFPGSDIYGGLANTWDYGPMGVELKNRVKKAWWRTFVQARQDIVGLDSAILMNPKVWEASGHVGSFADPLVDCKKCKQRFRGDKLLIDWTTANYDALLQDQSPVGTVTREQTAYFAKNLYDARTKRIKSLDGLSLEILGKMIVELKIPCPNCGATDFSVPKNFNLMFKTHQGVIEDTAALVYLRPETAQGIFVNFKNILDTMRPRLPFGIAQIGKAFRNEITPGNFTFRTREFEQMEIEYFVESETADEHFNGWLDAVEAWYVAMGVSKERLHTREHGKEELSHYSSRTVDIEYDFPWGRGELFGLANRGDFDLAQHEKFSGQDLKYTDPDQPTKKFLPHVIEPSFGCDRTVLTFLLEAYTEEKLPNDDTRVVMKFDRRLAPIDVAILPLSKKEHLISKAQEVYKKIVHETDLIVDFDVTGSIGKRYRRQDEVGTPRCVTVDFGTLGEDDAQGERDTVTVRDRDTLKQDRVSVSKLVAELKK